MARELIKYVQAAVILEDKLPPTEPPSYAGQAYPDWGSSGGNAAPVAPAYRRPEPPLWVVSALGSNDLPVHEGDELAIDDESEDPSIDVSADVAALPKTVNPDTLAFYLPFHFYRSRWGIYVKASGILALAGRILSTNQLTPQHESILNAVYRLLVEHEAFHHYAELAIARLETPPVLLSHGTYLYREYFRDVHAGLREEALANAHALRTLPAHLERLGLALSTARGVESLLAKCMQQQPPGYCDFEQWVMDSQFRTGKDLVIDAARACAQPALGEVPRGLVPGRQYFRDRRLGECQVYLVRDRPLPALKVARYFPAMYGMRVTVHTNDHRPPHFHLEIPVGSKVGRYEWPTLTSYLGAKILSRREMRDLRNYIDANQPKMFDKIRSVYPDVQNIA